MSYTHFAVSTSRLAEYWNQEMSVVLSPLVEQTKMTRVQWLRCLGLGLWIEELTLQLLIELLPLMQSLTELLPLMQSLTELLPLTGLLPFE
jgi:hypothetical protein